METLEEIAKRVISHTALSKLTNELYIANVNQKLFSRMKELKEQRNVCTYYDDIHIIEHIILPYQDRHILILSCLKNAISEEMQLLCLEIRNGYTTFEIVTYCYSEFETCDIYGAPCYERVDSDRELALGHFVKRYVNYEEEK